MGAHSAVSSTVYCPATATDWSAFHASQCSSSPQQIVTHEELTMKAYIESRHTPIGFSGSILRAASRSLTSSGLRRS